MMIPIGDHLRTMIQYELPANKNLIFRIESVNDCGWLEDHSPFVVINDYYGPDKQRSENNEFVVVDISGESPIPLTNFNSLATDDVSLILSHIKTHIKQLQQYYLGDDAIHITELT